MTPNVMTQAQRTFREWLKFATVSKTRHEDGLQDRIIMNEQKRSMQMQMLRDPPPSQPDTSRLRAQSRDGSTAQVLRHAPANDSVVYGDGSEENDNYDC